jgi:predicted metal-dependent HD superfamily phosphohydrolase
MDNAAPTAERVAVWIAMAEHFLDTDTQEDVPHTASLCVRSGLSIEKAREIWQHEVSPALYPNLWILGGEWAGWDEAWLVERILKSRRRLRGTLGYLAYRLQVQSQHSVWQEIERHMEKLLAAPMTKLDAAMLPFDLPEPLEAALRRAYEQPPRAYHHFGHVLEVLSHFSRVPEWHDRQAVALAILFHDAVYEAGRSDNEARSAELAATLLTGTPFERSIARVQHLVRLTARHGSLAPSDVDHDEALFLDCDMAILGADSNVYDAYERAIAEEYAHIPTVAYRAGRTRFLQKLLAKPCIYLSPFFTVEREALARANIKRALSQLESS